LFLHGCAGLTSYKPHPELNGYKETGMASFYARKFQNRKTASGELLNNNSMTAAYQTGLESGLVFHSYPKRESGIVCDSARLGKGVASPYT